MVDCAAGSAYIVAIASAGVTSTWSIARCGFTRGRWARAIRRRLQPRVAVQRLHFGRSGIAVEIAHQHGVGMVAEQLGDEFELRAAIRPGEMRHRHRQRGFAVAETRQQHATPARLADVVGPHLARLELAEQAVGAGGRTAHPPVRLVAPSEAKPPRSAR